MADQERQAGSSRRLSVVVIDRYDDDALPRLKRHRSELRSLAAVLAQSGWTPDDHDLTGDGRSETVRTSFGRWQPPGGRLLMLWGGHGRGIDGGGLWLCCRNTIGIPDPANALSAHELGQLLASKQVREAVLIIDACQAGGGAWEIVRAFESALAGTRRADGIRPSLAVISSASRGELAREAVFAQAMTRILRHGPPDDPDETWWTERDEFILPSELVRALRVTLRQWGVSQRPDHHMAGTVTRFFPNPRYAAFSPDVEVEAKQRRHSWLPADVREHFMMKFRGIDAAEDSGWFFTGRRQPLREIVSWLRTASSGLLVVTGPPGCGKSAVLGRLAVLSDTDYRAEAEQAGALRGMSDDTDPGVESVTAGIHAKNKTLLDCVGELADALDLPAPAGGWESAGQLVMAVARRPRDGRGPHRRRQRLTLLLDALDEARSVDMHAIARDLLRELASLPDVRVVVGTRPDRVGPGQGVAPDSNDDGPLLRSLGPQQTVRLTDDPESAAAVGDYVYDRLIRTDGSPYQDEPHEARLPADLVGERSEGIFLLGRLLTRALVDRDTGLDLASDEAARLLAGGVREAFAQDLARYGDDEATVRDLLTALAWGEGAGLPRRAVWTAVANALANDPQHYDDGDLAWLLSQAGAHLVESGEDGQTVYRLYHQMFDDYLRAELEQPEAAVQSAITTALLALAGTEGARDWPNINPYLLRHLATHAAGAGRLAELVVDARYLLHADSRRLARVLGSINPDQGPVLRTYWRVVHRLHDATPEQRAHVLHEAALLEEPDALTALPVGPEVAWRGLWTSGRAAPFHRRLVGHTAPVDAVDVGYLDDRAVVVSGGQDGTVRLWDAATGETLSTKRAQTRWVRSVALTQLRHLPVVVVAGDDGVVRVWEASSGDAAGRLDAGSWVEAIATAHLDGRLMVAAGSQDGTVWVWDVEEGWWHRLRGHAGWVDSVAFAELGGRLTVLSGGEDGRVRYWDAVTGESLQTLDAGVSWLQRVWVHTDDGDPRIVAQGLNGQAIWSACTAEEYTVLRHGHLGQARPRATIEVAGRRLVVTGGSDGVVLLENAGPADDGEPDRPDAEPPDEDDDLPTRAPTLAAASVAVGSADDQLLVVAAATDGATQVELMSDGREARPRRELPECSVGPAEWVAVQEVGGRPAVVLADRHGPLDVRDAGTHELLSVSGDSPGAPVAAGGAVDGRLAIVYGDEGAARWAYAPRLDQVGRQSGTGPVDSVGLGEVAGRAWVVTGRGGVVSLWDPEQRDPAGGWRLVGSTPPFAWVRSVAVGEVTGRLLVAAGSVDSLIRLWDGTRPGGASVLAGGPGWVEAVGVGELDGRPVVVAGNSEGTVRIWDVDTGEAVCVVEAEIGPVRSVALGVLAGCPVVVVGAEGGQVGWWNAVTGARVGGAELTTVPVSSVAVCASAGLDVVIYTGDDGVAQAWCPLVEPIGGWYRSVTIGDAATVGFGAEAGARTSREVVAVAEVDGREVRVTGDAFGRVRSWDASSGRTLLFSPRLRGPVRSVAVGELAGTVVVVAGGDDGAIRMWDLQGGRLMAGRLRPDPPDDERHPAPQSTRIGAVAVGQLTIGSEAILGIHGFGHDLVHPASGEVTTFMGPARRPEEPVACHGVDVGRIGDRVVIAGGGRRSVWLWDAERSERLTVLEVGARTVVSVSVTTVRDCPLVVAGTHDGEVLCWNPFTGSQRCWPRASPLLGRSGHRAPVQSVTATTMGDRAVVLSVDAAGVVQRRDAESGALFSGYRVDARGIAAMAVVDTGDEPLLAVGAADGVHILDPTTGEELTRIDLREPVRALALDRLSSRPLLGIRAGDRVHLVELLSRPMSPPPRAPESVDATTDTIPRQRPTALQWARYCLARLVGGFGVLLAIGVIAGAGLEWAWRYGNLDESIVPRDERLEGRPCGEEYPCFDPSAYAIDVLIPFVDLGQDDTWRPVETSDLDDTWVDARRLLPWAAWLPMLLTASNLLPYTVGAIRGTRPGSDDA